MIIIVLRADGFGIVSLSQSERDYSCIVEYAEFNAR